VKFLTYKWKHKLHVRKKDPWRRPTVTAETCRGINSQIKALSNKQVSNLTYAIQMHEKCTALKVPSRHSSYRWPASAGTHPYTWRSPHIHHDGIQRRRKYSSTHSKPRNYIVVRPTPRPIYPRGGPYVSEALCIQKPKRMDWPRPHTHNSKIPVFSISPTGRTSVFTLIPSHYIIFSDTVPHGSLHTSSSLSFTYFSYSPSLMSFPSLLFQYSRTSIIRTNWDQRQFG
jgi:hypothetical protein